MQELDILVIGPHPDDAELGAAGLLILARKAGYRTGILDLTRGELGTKGDTETRSREARVASEKLGLSVRGNLDLGDGRVADSPESRAELVRFLRKHRPRIVLAPVSGDRHPDHRAASELVRSSWFLCRLPRFLPEIPAFSPEILLYYFIQFAGTADLVVDIGPIFPEKIEVLRCYESQFVDPKLPVDYSYAGIGDYLGNTDLLSRHWGSLVGIARGEGFRGEKPFLLRDPGLLFSGPKHSGNELTP